METKIYNIDSRNRNTTVYPLSSNFTYNIIDTINNSSAQVIPFIEKNVIGINLLSIEIPNTLYYINADRGNNVFQVDSTVITIASGSYTCSDLISYMNLNIVILVFLINANTSKVEIASNDNSTHTILFPDYNNGYKSLGKILGFMQNTYTIEPYFQTATNVMTIPQEQFFFLRINDLGNIINNNTRYIAKNILTTGTLFVNTNSVSSFNYISNPIIFEQPRDIKDLKISLEDYKGNILNFNGSDISLTLEFTIITNTILKNYEEINFYSEPVMQRILQAKMLKYYEKNISKEENENLTQTYNTNLTNLNNKMEYTPFGNRNNYYKTNNIELSYFNNADIKK
jgi:hypothetical protein